MSTSKEFLGKIADENGLELVETTCEITGYPSNLKYAIIGFETYEQAEKIAQENSLSIEYFEKKDGWQQYYRTGNKAYQAFENGASDYGDMHSEFTKEDIDDFYEEEVKPFVGDFDDFDSLESFIQEQKEILEKLKGMSENEKVITYDGRYYETIPKTSMSCYIDVTTSAIGLIEY